MLGNYLLFAFIFLLLVILYFPKDNRIQLDLKQQEKANIEFKKNVTLDDEIFYIDYDVEDRFVAPPDPSLTIDSFNQDISGITPLGTIPTLGGITDIVESVDTIEGFADYNNLKLQVGSPSSIQRNHKYRDQKTKNYVEKRNKMIQTIQNMDMKDSRVRTAFEKKYHDMLRYEHNLTNLENKYG
jgi:hypothetical protein